jgi:hypothetical protein
MASSGGREVDRHVFMLNAACWLWCGLQEAWADEWEREVQSLDDASTYLSGMPCSSSRALRI